MARNSTGIYYLGRVLKFGQLTSETLSHSILNAKSITRGKHAWTFIETQEFNQGQYIFGKLSKYWPEAEIKKIDLSIKAEVTSEESFLSIATSPFVYIPAFSGIAFLHVANHILPEMFIKRFCEIVEGTNDNFFVKCEIEPITDLRSFAAKLQQIGGVIQLSATIHPPNPLFGPLWKPLMEYIQSRRVDVMTIKEESKEGESIKTNIQQHVAAVAEQTKDKAYIPTQELPIGDAAILMAADGYGNGQVKGRQGEQIIVVSTSETIRNFTFDRDPNPHDLYTIAAKLFEEIERDRHMQH